MAEEKRIFIKIAEPKICKHQMSDVTEYHDGNYDIDVWCGLSKERTKCNQSNCEKKEYDGIAYSDAIEKMAKAMCYNQSRYIVWKNCRGKNCGKCRYYIDWLHYAEAALKALLEDNK